MGGARVLINALSLGDGGGRSYVVNLLRELARDNRGMRFTVLLPSDALAVVPPGPIDAQVIELPRRPSWSAVPRVLYEETLLPVRARYFDLLYCVADLAPAFARTPTVVALRNLNIYDRRFYDTLRLRTLERLISAGLRRVRRVIFPSRAAAELIGDRLSIAKDRIEVIHHGIDPSVFSTGEPVRANAPYLFLPAALERHKNISVLIESLQYAEDSRLEAWVAGSARTDPRYATELQDLVSCLGLEGRVRFLGSVPYTQMMQYYRGAVALVFPSLLETFGHPLLEAMASGTPVIAADIPAFREVGAGAALYFSPQDPMALAEKIVQLRADQDATRMRVAEGRTRIASFSWKSSIDRLCGVFEAVLSKS